MTIYDPNEPGHSGLMAQWWARTYQSGDLGLMMAKRAHSLAPFLKIFDPPTVLLFEFDENGIWIAGWFEPTFDGAFFSLWVRPDKRSREALPVLFSMYDLGFKAWPILLGVTKQERLLRSHERLGYRLVGKIEKFFDGEDAWLVQLTRESYAEQHQEQESEVA